ncbi:MAG: Gfo/Idh/MocA family oxidoreductase [Bacteroidota bacterium]|jgi:predicted dehydrogenase|nr:oxidoreductase [Flavobacteriaceae bacterium]MEC7877054.1 Gfo/Idh/MocA family oxidoreductase [Bacteroidota bacterium]MEC8602571.1 Gfo/Idh/MocA family oxidoreductase [Bacteroidota bacterium]|tara:strand:- start:2280 stop:3236 length:957 start_codon:yes stop_codon:yes gene_type:complete
MLNIAVIGAGHLGEFHIKLLKSSKLFNLIGFFDPNKSRVKEIIDKYNINFIEIDKISSLVDAVIISTPTSFHYETAVKFLNNKKHVFVEKPITSTIEQANKLIEIKKNNKLIGQVGHVERFNSAFLSIKDALNPMFIESHRLSSYPSRGTDVSVVLDLMIHDIDIVLSLVDSKITKISANGTKIISSSPDIANARIEFENGCVANLTSSRLSLKKMRKMRVFQTDSYISLDFDSGSSEIIKIKNFDGKNNYAMTIHDSEGVEKEIQIENITNEKINSIEEEHKNFYYSIIKKEDPIVSFEKGRNALKLAIEILKIIEN